MINVRDIMTPCTRTVHRDAFVSKVAEIFNREQISGAPLVDNDGHIVGIITEWDVNNLELSAGNPNLTQAWQVACPDVVSLPASATLRDAAQTILDTKVRNLVITDGETLAGLLSVSDIVQFVDDQIRRALTPAIVSS